MKIIVYERMYSTHIIKLKLILLWFIETKKCMITLCGTGGTMKLFTCSKWSTHACLHPYLCHENCEFVKSFVFWSTVMGIRGKPYWEKKRGNRIYMFRKIIVLRFLIYTLILQSVSIINIFFHMRYTRFSKMSIFNK